MTLIRARRKGKITDWNAERGFGFIVYWMDKSAARKGQWRTKESSLLLLGLVGGWPGAVIAQRVLRHKTRKVSFQVAFWGSVVMNVVAVGWLLSDGGSKVLHRLLN